jgi:hypothetical protein
MSRPDRHDRNDRRVFSGQDDAELVLELLNRPLQDKDWLPDVESVESRDRVLAVISCIRKHLQEIERTSGWPLTRELNQPGEIWDEFEDLNGLLSRYTSCPVFYPDKDSERGWNVGESFFIACPHEEALAVQAVAELSRQNRLHRLQLCECSLWFFAKFSHQKFCSEGCRVKFWESSEVRKKQKRQRARDNYLYKKAHRGE